MEQVQFIHPIYLLSFNNWFSCDKNPLTLILSNVTADWITEPNIEVKKMFMINLRTKKISFFENNIADDIKTNKSLL